MQEENQILNTKTIYVRLLDEDIDVYRPVKALKLKDNLYRILDNDKVAYSDCLEEWEFKQGDVVKGINKYLSEGNKSKEPTLVAIKNK